MPFNPKHLFGPSASGAAQSRALELRGGDWQWSQRDANTIVKKQGDFRKVLTSGLEYLTSGLVSSTVRRTFGTLRYQVPYAPSPTAYIVDEINIGSGQYAAWGAFSRETTNHVYTYEIYPGVTANYSTTRYTYDVVAYVTSFYGGDRYLGNVSMEFVVNEGLIPNLPKIAYVQSVPGDKVMLGPTTLYAGRSDAAGRRLYDVAIFTWRTNSASSGFTLPTASFTHPLTSFHPMVLPIATQDVAFVLTAEEFFAAGPVEVGRNYQPRLWVAHFPDKNFDGGSISDITATLFPDIWFPGPATFPVDHYGPGAGNQYNSNMSVTLGFMKTAVLPNNRALLFYNYYRPNDVGPGVQMRQCIGRISHTGSFSAEMMFDEFAGAGSGIKNVQSVVHLGEGWVLAKQLAGLYGVNWAVTFLLSTDSGETWTEFTPAGFNHDMLNQFFGDLLVHRSRAGGEHGVVLINSWDAATQAYYTYASSDSGLNWVRRGMIHRPDVFRRIDHVLDGDGGGNFEDLLPGPNPARPVDVTILDRYAP